MGKLKTTIVNTRYIKKDVTKEWLQLHGFKYNSIFSDEESDAYTYRFPVHKYGLFTILECEILIYINTGEVKINVYDYNTRSKYAPFYYKEYGNNTLVSSIEKKILSELKRLKIFKYKRNNKHAND